MQTSETTTSSPTASAMDHLARFGATPSFDEVDHRPIPEDEEIGLSIGCLSWRGSAWCCLYRRQSEAFYTHV